MILRLLKIVAVVLAVVFVGMVVNAALVSGATKPAAVRVEGGELIDTSEGTVQVVDEGDPEDPALILVHGYAASVAWWDRLAPLLAEDHRVVRIDLVGHGGSEKPSGPHYSVEAEAQAVIDVMKALEIGHATLIGHSLGGAVVTAVAEAKPRRVTGLVIIDTVTRPENAELSSTAQLAYVPVVGQAVKRWVDVAPPAWNASAYAVAFAPGFDTADGFDDPDQPVLDGQAMTYGSFTQVHDGYEDYLGETPLDERLAELDERTLVLFGTEDQIAVHADADLRAYARVARTQIAEIEGSGHSPPVEAPEPTARRIREWLG